MIIVNGLTLARQPAVDAGAKAWVGYPVGGAGDDGHEAARQFVLALGAPFKALQAMADGVFDAAVVAQLEVQAIHLLQRAPVAAIQIGAVPQTPTGCNGLPGTIGHEQHAVLAQGLAHLPEKVQVKVGRGAVLQIGLTITTLKKLPVLIGDFICAQGLYGNTGITDLAPLLADFLALALRQVAKEIIEIGIVLVQPVKLHTMTQQPASVP